MFGLLPSATSRQCNKLVNVFIGIFMKITQYNITKINSYLRRNNLTIQWMLFLPQGNAKSWQWVVKKVQKEILHAHFFSSLLRLAKINKFMASCEMLVYPQRKHTREITAVLLRMQSLKYIIDSDQIQ